MFFEGGRGEFQTTHGWSVTKWNLGCLPTTELRFVVPYGMVGTTRPPYQQRNLSSELQYHMVVM